jgi:nitrous oxidase accessory protein NosD
MGEIQGRVDRDSQHADSKPNGRPRGVLDRGSERIGNKNTIRVGRHARKTNLVVAKVIVAAFFLTVSLVMPISLLSDAPDKVPKPTRALALGPHDPVRIDGNGGFTNVSGVVQGSGSASDPYIIGGWDIDAHGGFYCIFVGNTTLQFGITNCILHNATPQGSEQSDTGIGINFINVTNGAILQNNISSNAVGISVWDSADYSGWSNNILVSNNVLSNCSMFGFYSDCDSPTLLATENSISDNGYGVLSFGSNNQICDNSIFNSTNYGIYMAGNSNRIWNNTFYHNNGSADTYDPSRMQACDYGTNNHWNTSGSPHDYGNYWSDWTGPDDDMDGIVDLPYNISGTAGAKDNYPLTTPQAPIPEFGMMPFVVMVLLVVIVFAGEARRRKAK